MVDVIYIIMSAALVYIIGYPIVEWIRQTKEKMEDEKHDDGK